MAAEIDEELRQIVAVQTGLKLDRQWIRMHCGTNGIYVDDVTKVIDNNSRILREAAMLSGDGHWIVIS